MPFNENFIPPGSTAPNHPSTNNLVTHSFDDRQLTAEFDDALVDQKTWKNSRYDGSKLTAAKINKFTAGDESYQNLPVLSNQITALYIANTVVGGTEDPQFATLKGHSYVGINKILLINNLDNTVQLIDRTTEPFTEFQRFITNDFPTGNKAYVKLIDDTVQTNLKGRHRVKMNKGYLLKSFDFHYGGEVSGSDANTVRYLTENNSMYVYKSGSLFDNFYNTGSISLSPTSVDQNNALRFRFGVIELFFAESASYSVGHAFNINRAGPNFESSSIVENKFTIQYYSGSFGNILHQPDDYTSSNDSKAFAASGLGSASRFLAVDTLDFLTSQSADTTLSEQEKTEVHITFFEGTKDFAPGTHDERSIGTFEVDQNIANLMVEQGGECNANLPTNHELVFKGRDDGRFLPTLQTFEDVIHSAHLASSSAANSSIAIPANGCGAPGSLTSGSGTATSLGTSVVVDRIQNIQCFVQGGALGQIGFDNAVSGTKFEDPTFGDGIVTNDSYGVSLSGSMTIDNLYSGSFRYEMSFLDKDHTLILDLDKDAELFDGIGNSGLVIIPQDTVPSISNNVEYYLSQAGIISNTVNITQNTSNDSQPLGTAFD